MYEKVNNPSLLIFYNRRVPFIASADTTCATKYPIVLSHGMWLHRHWKLGIGYWYNIPSTLTGHGAKVYQSNQTAMAATSDGRLSWKPMCSKVLATTGAAKVNIIGLSQGGLTPGGWYPTLAWRPMWQSLTTVAVAEPGQLDSWRITGTWCGCGRMDKRSGDWDISLDVRRTTERQGGRAMAERELYDQHVQSRNTQHVRVSIIRAGRRPWISPPYWTKCSSACPWAIFRVVWGLQWRSCFHMVGPCGNL